MNFYKELNKLIGSHFDSNDEIDFQYVFENFCLSEETIERILYKLFSNDNMYHLLDSFIACVSELSYISEDFIEKHLDKFYWDSISINQTLSEKFIEKYSDKIDWNYISLNQCLSEDFIERNLDKINLDYVCSKQKLSEDFISRHNGNYYYYELISKFKQNLSENFIEKNKDKVNWSLISEYQKLSEDFIRKNKFKVNWHLISKFQKLSNEFQIEFKNYLDQELIKNNWNYKSIEEKKKAVVDTGKYECHDDYFIAHKAIRPDRYSLFNFQYKYEKGGIYESWCDCSWDEDSFGLNVGTEMHAKSYGKNHNKYIIVGCKVKYEDVGRVVHNGDKIRCFKIEILD